MNRKILTIILAVLLIASFFLPLGATGSTSAFDVVQLPSFGNSIEAILMKYLWLVMPLSGIMLLIGALNKETYFLGRGLWAMLPSFGPVDAADWYPHDAGCCDRRYF